MLWVEQGETSAVLSNNYNHNLPVCNSLDRMYNANFTETYFFVLEIRWLHWLLQYEIMCVKVQRKTKQQLCCRNSSKIQWKKLIGKGKNDTPCRQIYENLLFWLSDGVNIVVWTNNYLRHIWYLICTYICLCFTFCCLLSPVEAILASSDEHDFIICRSSWNFLSSMFRNSVGCQCEKCFVRLSSCKEIWEIM